MRRITSMLAVFLFLCSPALADSAEQSELLGWIKKLNGLIEPKSTTRAVLVPDRVAIVGTHPRADGM